MSGVGQSLVTRTKGEKPTADQVITFRVTAEEAEALARKLEKQAGKRLSRAGYCRSLLVKDLRGAGLMKEPKAEPVAEPYVELEAVGEPEKEAAPVLREYTDEEIREMFGGK